MSAPHSVPPQPRTGKAFQLALVVAALAWSLSSRLLSASSARGLTNRFNADWATTLLAAIFLIFLLGVGFTLLEAIARRPTTIRQSLALPPRASAPREWLTGAALGWGIVTATVLPMALAGDLYVSFWLEPRAFLLFFFNLLVIAVTSLAQEIIFRGYPFRRLIDAIGPVAATCFMSLLFAITCAIEDGAGRLAVVIAFLSSILFSISWLRTHGLWMAWGMRFAWTASMGALFGLPVAGSLNHATLIQTNAIGRPWVTGEDYGPEASAVMILALIAGLILLVRVTRDYAWNYTHPEIVPGGYPMDIAPPPAHAAMEEAAKAKQNSLVQILPMTPQGRSADSEPNP